MRLKALFEAIVGIGKIIIDIVEFDDENDKIYIDARLYKKERCRYGICLLSSSVNLRHNMCAILVSNIFTLQKY